MIFNLLETKPNTTSILILPKFDQAFEIEVDTCMEGIGVILAHEGRLVKVFSEKLDEAKQKMDNLCGSCMIFCRFYNDESITLSRMHAQ